MEPKEFWTIWSSASRPRMIPFSLTSSSCGLGGVEDFKSRLALVGCAGDGGRADEHELAQQALVFDDANVVFDDGPHRQTLGEGREVGHAADGFDLLGTRQFVGQGNDVDGTLLIHQLAHAQEDALVRVEREVVGLKALGGFGVRGVVEQDGAEDGFFGVDIRGQAGVERSDVRQGGHTLV